MGIGNTLLKVATLGFAGRTKPAGPETQEEPPMSELTPEQAAIAAAQAAAKAAAPAASAPLPAPVAIPPAPAADALAPNIAAIERVVKAHAENQQAAEAAELAAGEADAELARLRELVAAKKNLPQLTQQAVEFRARHDAAQSRRAAAVREIEQLKTFLRQG